MHIFVFVKVFLLISESSHRNMACLILPSITSLVLEAFSKKFKSKYYLKVFDLFLFYLDFEHLKASEETTSNPVK